MINQLSIRGLPASLAQDGWWLSCEANLEAGKASADAENPDHLTSLLGRPKTIALILLTSLADFLFWQYAPGISAALFAFALFAAATLNIRPRRALIRPALCLLLSALPVMDYLQLLSMAFLSLGLIVSLVWAHKPSIGGAAFIGSAIAFLQALPSRWGSTCLGLVPWVQKGRARSKGLGSALRGFLRNWGFPIGGAIVFVGLLADANPVLSGWLSFDIDGGELFTRAVFWAGVALMIWPIIDGEYPDATEIKASTFRVPSLGLNEASVLRSLWVFNAIIGLQTALDLTILMAGAALPEGMSYASYAHRGAYPLLATALLAGLFALAARRFFDGNKLIRPLMLLWLGQNVLLCLSAMLRLDLYVDVYGLTYLRIYAFVWMGFVATGLTLTAWQAFRGLSNLWLLGRASGVAVSVLYVTSFINFAHMIADHNLRNLSDRTDLKYLCQLGEMAAPVLYADEEAWSRNGASKYFYWTNCHLSLPAPKNWREWGFRDYRAARYTSQAVGSESVE